VTGGYGDDVIAGRADDNRLHGGPGDDIVRGSDRGNDFLWGDGGADRLFGGEGRDSLAGGPGPDVLDGGRDLDFLSPGDHFPSYYLDEPPNPDDYGDPGSAHVARCGDGPDYVAPAGPRDLFGDDCDRAIVFGAGPTVLGLHLPLARARSPLGWIGGRFAAPRRFRFTCARESCPRVDLTVAEGSLRGTRVGGRVLRPRTRREFVKPAFGLDARGRAILQRRRRLRLRVTLTTPAGHGSFLVDARLGR
jgi:hypothetical protein